MEEKNTGVILGKKKSDWNADDLPVGADPYEVRNPSGDWTPWLVRGEKQWYPGFDTMACVSFSANTLAEIQIKQQTGEEVNFSDRFLAKMSGTTTQGNWLYIVGDTLRKIGGVLEEEWPVPPEPFGWNDYYTEIPQFVKDRAKKQFLDKYDIQLSWVEPTIEAIKKHLKHAPLQIVFPNHAVANYGTVVGTSGNKLKYFDTYEPWLKEIDISLITSVYKILLTVKGSSMFTVKKVKVNGSFGVLVGTPNMVNITLAEDEAEWRSYGKSDSYKVLTVNPDGSTNWQVDLEFNF